MRNDNSRYFELAKAKITENQNIIISRYSSNGEISGFTIAQQVELKENGSVLKMFKKGAIHIDGVDELYNIRDALNLAITKAEQEQK